MIIDAHVHIWTRDFQEEKRTIEFARRHNVDKLCISNVAYRPIDKFEDCLGGNRELVEVMNRYPDLIVGFAYVNPRHGDLAVRELRECVEQFGMKGMKLLSNCYCNELIVFPLIEKTIELDIPTLIHCGHVPHEPKGEETGIYCSDPVQVAELAQKYPEAKIIQAHVGGGGIWEWAIKAIRDCPNVFLDLSGSVCDLGIVEMCIAELGAHRIVWGTDGSLYSCLGKIYGAEISEENRRLILGSNMAKLLRITARGELREGVLR